MSADESSSPIPMHRYFGSSEAVPGSWANVWEQSCLPVLRYIPMITACYGVSFFLLQKYTGWSGLKLQKLAGSLSMYPPILVLVYTSHLATFDSKFWTSGAIRFQDSDEWTDLFANFYIATNIVQAIGQVQTEKPPLLYQLMAHHVLSVACYTAGFYFDRFRWWTAFAGTCEITNLFLIPVFACKEFFPEWRKEKWFLWNSRLLWLTFITHRLILFPCWLGLWVKDRLEAAAKEEDDNIHWMEGVIYPVTILGLFILSCIWFMQIDRGLKKQLVVYMEAKNK